MQDFKSAAPVEWQNHWASMTNNVDALYGTFENAWFPFIRIERRIEAWGQLCFDDAACRAAAYHMHNNHMRKGWRFISWRCEMSTPPVGGGKLSGVPPKDFSLKNYFDDLK